MPHEIAAYTSELPTVPAHVAADTFDMLMAIVQVAAAAVAVAETDLGKLVPPKVVPRKDSCF